MTLLVMHDVLCLQENVSLEILEVNVFLSRMKLHILHLAILHLNVPGFTQEVF